MPFEHEYPGSGCGSSGLSALPDRHVCRTAGSGRYLTTVNSRYLAGVTGPPGPASGTGEYSSQAGVDIAKAPTGLASTSRPLGDT
jgi:hypothetical protein